MKSLTKLYSEAIHAAYRWLEKPKTIEDNPFYKVMFDDSLTPAQKTDGVAALLAPGGPERRLKEFAEFKDYLKAARGTAEAEQTEAQRKVQAVIDALGGWRTRPAHDCRQAFAAAPQRGATVRLNGNQNKKARSRDRAFLFPERITPPRPRGHAWIWRRQPCCAGIAWSLPIYGF